MLTTTGLVLIPYRDQDDDHSDVWTDFYRTPTSLRHIIGQITGLTEEDSTEALLAACETLWIERIYLPYSALDNHWIPYDVANILLYNTLVELDRPYLP